MRLGIGFSTPNTTQGSLTPGGADATGTFLVHSSVESVLRQVQSFCREQPSGSFVATIAHRLRGAGARLVANLIFLDEFYFGEALPGYAHPTLQMRVARLRELSEELERPAQHPA